MLSSSAIVTGITCVISFGALLYQPIAHRAKVLGAGRWWADEMQNIHGHGLTYFEDTYGCEDLHFYEPQNVIFGIAEEKRGSRFQWFPPIAKFNLSDGLGQAHFFLVHPEDDKVTPLKFNDFQGPFIAHGFDIYPDPYDSKSLYFFAINHLPNPAYATLQGSPDIPQARSQIDVFKHTLGTLEVTYVRSIQHPLIRTPNDIFVVNGDSVDVSLFVTNDHFNREAGVMRMLEDFGFNDFGAWSDIVHVSILDFTPESATAGITANVALSDIQNPNGLGHGPYKNKVYFGRAASGIMHALSISPEGQYLNYTKWGTKQMPSCMDNPTYFHDPYAGSPGAAGRDESGFVIAGLAFAATFPDTPANPVVVWLLQPPKGGKGAEEPIEAWTPRKIFADDGRRLNTVATAVLVGIDPKGNGGKKQAWLFAAGPMAEGIVKTKIDL